MAGEPGWVPPGVRYWRSGMLLGSLAHQEGREPAAR
jgi:hypothetical protein